MRVSVARRNFLKESAVGTRTFENTRDVTFQSRLSKSYL